MKERYKRITTGSIASLAFGGIVCLFWGLLFPHHLHYHEQFQLFLFTLEYALDKLSHPGGMMEYLAEFLTQFYYLAWAGATILAAVLLIVQRQVRWLSRRLGAAACYESLTFLPSLCLWSYLCDENAMLALPLSVAGTLAAMQLYQRLPERKGIRYLYALLLTPLLYGAVGGAGLLFTLWVSVAERRRISGAALLLLVGILCPIVAQSFVQYPLTRLVAGIDYYRYPMIVPPMMIVATLSVVVVPWILGLLPQPGKETRKRYLTGAAVVAAIGGSLLLYASVDLDMEETLEYDYLTRMKQWDRIVRAAEKKNPDSPFAVTCLNLALAMKGELGDRMFQFYQNGTEGLLPAFQRHFTTPLPASEAFYHLGMINTSQRYTFEAMEAIPNYNKSGRAYKRLAETNLINGEYAVAAKYLKALQKTFFYRKWATHTLQLLGNEAKIDMHPEWGKLRQLRYKHDFLFSEVDMKDMLGLLLTANGANRMAFEYLLAYVLLNNDVEHFMKYYPLGRQMGYNHIPLSYQEALVFVWTQQHSSFQGMPWSISRQVMDGITEFATIYTKRKDSEELLRTKYGKTYWYYILFRK